jgi:hypothetical protein
MHFFSRIFLSVLVILFLCQCSEKDVIEQFTLLESSDTGLKFRNKLKEDENFNIFKYQYYYNGGGVAIADFNNDGMQDVFFTGNMVKNRLFLNEGDLEFKDITETSGVALHEGWCTGTNAVDINNDGWMDIYVCRAGYPFPNLRKNLLLINNGNLTFSDKAAEYGLDDDSYSTHSAFLDYDKDGDLDMFLLNHSDPQYSKGSLEIFKLKNKREPELESKLFRNDNGKFVNVTESAGIKGNVLSFSLGLGVVDINNDGWTDIFIGNDFNESDYLFMNNGDGTFTEKSKSVFDHTSMFSMGCDIADINNDGHMDLVSLDMLPESNYLQKLHSGADNFNKISDMINRGFQPQFSKNVLQVNNSDGTFSESAQLYGVANTDWSWSSLFLDFDNDSYQDLFISNGYLKDHTDMDFLQFTADQVIKADKGENPVSFEEYMASMPPIIQPNYFYQNSAGKNYINKNTAWKLTKATVSGAAAYGDLDNDGDLDLITTSVGDEYAILYRNNQNQASHHYIAINLKGPSQNINGIGARVTVYAANQILVKDHQPSRGFQATMDYRLYFGLGSINKIDSVKILWADGKTQKVNTLKINQLNDIKYAPDQFSNEILVKAGSSRYKEDTSVPSFLHENDNFEDFKVQGLLTHFISDRGPKICKGDFNGDNLEDFILSGNSRTSSKIYIQNSQGTFIQKNLPVELLEISEITTIKNKNTTLPDLALSVGSYKYESEYAKKGIYILKNAGNGTFTNATFIPTPETNPSSLLSVDLNSDGADDLIVGGHCDYRKYPLSTPSLILKNDGKNDFTITDKVNLGMINDIVAYDLNGDQQSEIIMCGDWTPILVFDAKKLTFNDVSKTYFDQEHKGMWKKIHFYNFQGNTKLICGNWGLNSQLTATTENPMYLYYEDYDNNGSYDPIIAHHIMDGIYPFAPREDMIKQIPILNKRFNTFGAYAKADIKTLLGENHFAKAKPLTINTLETTLFNMDNGKFRKENIDHRAQLAPVYAIEKIDHKAESNLILAGNQSKVRVKLGRLNGNHGQYYALKNNEFQYLPKSASGFNCRNDVRDVATIKTSQGDLIVFSIYNDKSMFYRTHN